MGLGTSYFIHSDWLGTERARSNTAGTVTETCTSLPYGDDLVCAGTDVSPLHFTGKMRDAETGLDDFPARYYSSGQGRWYSPDWASAQVPVPYADLHNPQSLNLYDYVGSDPTNHADADGHFWLDRILGFGDAEKNKKDSQGTADAQTAQNTNTQSVGNVVHNETGGLRPEAKEGSGSSQDLHNAKVAVADVVENREKAGNNGGVASDKVSSKERNTPQYKDAQQAAAEAARSNVTGGSSISTWTTARNLQAGRRGKKQPHTGHSRMPLAEGTFRRGLT